MVSPPARARRRAAPAPPASASSEDVPLADGDDHAETDRPRWADDARDAFDRWVSDADYPCIMAKSVVKTEQYCVRPYDALDDAESARQLAADLTAYAQEPEPERGYRSFLAVFERPSEAISETEFERLFWATLARVHDADGAPWDPSVAADPEHPQFSFSVGGRAFYVVGMHPGASRQARRFPRPLIAFNLHSQFEALRRDGRYQSVRNTIRDRDRALQGSVNPSLQDFGTTSEARQYAGRAAGADWRCPFQPRPDAAAHPSAEPASDAD